MNKNDLVAAIAERTDLNRKQADVAVTAAFEAIVEALARQERVQLSGFGTLEVRSRAPRVGRNPKTGEAVEIPPAKAPVFRPGKAMKDAIQ